MNLRSIISMLVMATLLTSAVSAHVVTSSDQPTGTYAIGETFTFSTTVQYHCTDAGVEAFDGVGTVANASDYAWLEATESTVSYDPTACAPSTDPDEPGLLTPAQSFDTTVTVGSALAFVDYSLQPGIVNHTNVGGDFVIQVAYNPEFTAPTALAFDATADGAIATIPLISAANADSVFGFEVTDFMFDGVAAPEGATAHIQETLEVATGIATEEGTTSASVELHFGAPDATMDHSDHEDMEHGSSEDGAHDGHAAESGHFHWETATATVAITLAAAADDTQVSDAQNVIIAFVNTDVDSMPHEEGGEGNGDVDDESTFLPGFELVAAVAALGAAAVLIRRRN